MAVASDPSRLTDFKVIPTQVSSSSFVGSTEFIVRVFWHKVKGSIQKVIVSVYLEEEVQRILIREFIKIIGSSNKSTTLQYFDKFSEKSF